jgi:DNA-binding transcriptional MerR regulator
VRGLGVTDDTIRRWEARGLTPTVPTSGMMRTESTDRDRHDQDRLPELITAQDVVTVSKGKPVD